MSTPDNERPDPLTIGELISLIDAAEYTHLTHTLLRTTRASGAAEPGNSSGATYTLLRAIARYSRAKSSIER